MAGRRGTNEIALEDRAQPLRAIYQHWERHQWSPYEVDFATDAASFAALDEERREALMWAGGDLVDPREGPLRRTFGGT